MTMWSVTDVLRVFTKWWDGTFAREYGLFYPHFRAPHRLASEPSLPAWKSGALASGEGATEGSEGTGGEQLDQLHRGDSMSPPGAPTPRKVIVEP